MTSERSLAYGRVMKTLADIGPAKLHADEQELVREAADTLFFAEDARDSEIVDRVDALVTRLVDSGRLLEETGHKLMQDLEDAGPAPAIA
jgi:hypothetical protein